MEAEVPLLEGEEYTEVGVEAILSNMTFRSCRLSLHYFIFIFLK